jgi:peptide/nickel transport system substrate-binding protein
MNHRHPFARAFAICALLIIGVLGVAACGGSSSSSSSSSASSGSGTSKSPSVDSVAYGSLPPQGTQSAGGTITAGQLTGQTPDWILPIVPSANASTYGAGFLYSLFLPLYTGQNGGAPEINYALSLAPKPAYSDGDKTVTINMKQGFKWANGAPVDAADIIFDIDLLKAAVKESPSNWSNFVPGQFPASVVSATAPSKYQLVIKLNKAYNPNYFINNQLEGAVYALPSTSWNVDKAGGPHLDYANPTNAKKIYDYLSSQAKSLSGFATNPLWQDVDGPFKLKSFSATNSSFTFVPNASYGGTPKASATINFETFTSTTAQLNALESGSLEIGGLDPGQLGSASTLKRDGYTIFGSPSFGWFASIINFKDQTGHFAEIIKQLYVRQALAHLINQPAYVKGIYKNAATVNYGPVPQQPISPYVPENNKSQGGPYPFSPSTAVSLLKSHGWKVVPNGQTTCQKAGSGTGECGAGIPAGTPLKFNWVDVPQAEAPADGLEGQAFASEAKSAAGINVELETKTFQYAFENYDNADPADAKNENQWAFANTGGFSYDFYPSSEGIFNTGGVFNEGSYSDPQADKLMNASVFSSKPSAVTSEAQYLTQSLPVLFMPQQDILGVVSNKVGGPAIGYASYSSEILFPQYWWVNK